jgi:hypothetical protein
MARPVSLEQVRHLHGYVLLGDPGSGKSAEFEREAQAAGVATVTVNDFLMLPSAMINATNLLFIDGLDESRAGGGDGRTVMQQIRVRLIELGRPPFRLSCRAADWLGQSDAQKLQTLAPDGGDFEVYRLDPLAEDDIAKILSHNHGIPAPDAFIAQAEEHNLQDLLSNPQTLDLLASAVGDTNEWPASRRETYELACNSLSRECNEEHLAVGLSRASRDDLHQAAGYLSVIALLADLRGFSRLASQDERTLTLSDIPNPQRLPLSEAISTRLFKEVTGGVFAPVHRTVAEYLGAKHVATKLEAQLPLKRFLAYICGADGGVVSGMRGLHAWLSTLALGARPTLIELDPLGILLYGDAKAFQVSNKLALIEALRRLAEFSSTFRWQDWDSKPFAALASPDMYAAVSRLLGSTDRRLSSQAIAMCLLEGLEHAGAPPELDSLLLGIIRDGAWAIANRHQALDAYAKRGSCDTKHLIALLDDLISGVVDDDNGELLGAALLIAYPVHVDPSSIFRYLVPFGDSSRLGRDYMFWHYYLIRQTPVESIPILLDSLANDLHRARRDLPGVVDLVSNALAIGLVAHGDSIDDARLLRWLEVGCDEYRSSRLNEEHGAQVRNWLSARPQRYLSVLALAVDRPWTDALALYYATDLLHGATSPENLGEWWIHKARDEPLEQRALEFFHRAIHCIPTEGPSVGQGLDAVWALASSRGWTQVLEKSLTCDLEKSAWRRKKRGVDAERSEEAARRRQIFREMLPRFKDNTLPARLLCNIAQAGAGRFLDIQAPSLRQRLSVFFGGDGELVEAGVQALIGAIERAELSEPHEIIESGLKNSAYFIDVAAAVGAELAHQQAPEFLDAVPDSVMLSLLVYRFVDADRQQQGWFDRVVLRRPSFVAQAFSMYFLSFVADRRRFVEGTHLLVGNPQFEVVAGLVVPQLVPQIPDRVYPNSDSAVTNLLKAALKHVDVRTLDATATDKLNFSRRIDSRQRAQWCAIGFLINPVKYAPSISRFLKNRPRRQCAFSGFLHGRHTESSRGLGLPSVALALAIELMGGASVPDRAQGGKVTSLMNQADLLHEFIHELSSRGNSESAQELARLEQLPSLGHWHAQLRHARMTQAVVMRDQGHSRPSAADVCTMLNQGPPRTAADIAAVVDDVLTHLTADVRNSDLNIYRQFWNVDSHGRPNGEDRPEEICRDAMAVLLRERVRCYSLLLSPETRHADAKRSDLWCANTDHGVPIEIKKDSHSGLWEAIDDQLVAKYTTDPRCQGHGVMIALWFGDPKRVPRSPSGKRPATAVELGVMLNLQIPAEKKHLLTARVIDCSVPSVGATPNGTAQ